MTPGMPLAPVGQRQLDLGESMPVGRDRAQDRLARRSRRVEIDAVQIIARLLGRDGEARLLDETLEVGGGQRKVVAEIIDAERGEIVGRQRLERELRRPARDDEPSLLAVLDQLDIVAFGELAHDVVEHMGGHGGRAFALGARRHRLDQLHVEIGRGQLQLVVAGLNRTFDRMGMVFRRSTTLATWASARAKPALSMVSRMARYPNSC